MRHIARNSALHHSYSKSITISPLSILPLININNKYNFSTKKQKLKPKKSKIKIAEDEYDQNMEEATIEKETQKTFRQRASPTISNIQFSDDEDAGPSTLREKIHKAIAVHILGLDNILPRMIALKDKDPEAITQSMNLFYIANCFTGTIFFLLSWQCASFIVYPELMAAYIMMRFGANFPPNSIITHKFAELSKLKYPLLNKCNFSIKMPDPNAQSVDAFANKITDRISLLQKPQTFLDTYTIGHPLKMFRERRYSNAIKYGFAWDIADNCRMLIGLPLLFGLLHQGGIGLYMTDLEGWNPIFAHWVCIYAGGIYGARLTSNWTLRTMVLTVIEKRFGLRGDTGEYYGFSKNETSDDGDENVSNAKVSSRKPRK